MYSMAELLVRARAFPRGHLNPIEGTDPVKLRFPFNVRLNVEDIPTPEEVAARLKVPNSWVYEKNRAGCRNPMPCLRLGRYVRFDWSAVITWLTAASTQEQNAARTSLPPKRKLVR
jgi:excisionase family DNA binding protein